MNTKLSLRDKVAQLVFPGFTFGQDDPLWAERLVRLGVGGFCLYGGSVREVDDFTRGLQSLARIPLLFCADYEDGISQHVKGGTAFPSNMGLAATDSEVFAYQKALITAIEARAIGVRWVLAPVLDLATQPSNPIVNVRSFGEDARIVARFGNAYMKGLAAEKVLSCAKHFPGHGETLRDSHLELPALKATRAQLLKRELAPFRLCADRASSVMTAHLHIPALSKNSKLPSSLSKNAVSLLRKDLDYKRLVVTDALNMRSVVENCRKEENACVAALTAGNDILLVPSDPLKVLTDMPKRVAMDARLQKLVDDSSYRVMIAKDACALFVDRGIDPEKAVEMVGKARHVETAERMAAQCLWMSRRGKKQHAPAIRAVRYLEPDAPSPGQWQGRAFIEELKNQGVEVQPWSSRGKGPVVVASFIRPRAYSGRIQLSAQEKLLAQKALSQRSNGIFVSFGSPFVLDQLQSWATGLCAFSALDCSQRVAARAMLGRIPAPGKMPVTLRCMGKS